MCSALGANPQKSRLTDCSRSKLRVNSWALESIPHTQKMIHCTLHNARQTEWIYRLRDSVSKTAIVCWGLFGFWRLMIQSTDISGKNNIFKSTKCTEHCDLTAVWVSDLKKKGVGQTVSTDCVITVSNVVCSKWKRIYIYIHTLHTHTHSLRRWLLLLDSMWVILKTTDTSLILMDLN